MEIEVLQVEFARFVTESRADREASRHLRATSKIQKALLAPDADVVEKAEASSVKLQLEKDKMKKPTA